MAFKQAFEIQNHYPILGKALVTSMQPHSWYLTEQLVILALGDEDVEINTKVDMMKQLVGYPVPQAFRQEKPELPVIDTGTDLPQLVGPESWLLLEIAGVSKEDVNTWIESRNIASSFKSFVKSLTCVHDCSERNVRLIQDYIDGYQNEDMTQNLLLVARDNRKRLKHDMTKNQFENL